MTTKARSTQQRRVAVLGGNRIPFARSDRKYARASNQDMFTATLDGLVGRFNLQGERLGAVVGGAVLKHARDFNLVRESVLGSALSPYTPAWICSRPAAPACSRSSRSATPSPPDGSRRVSAVASIPPPTLRSP